MPSSKPCLARLLTVLDDSLADFSLDINRVIAPLLDAALRESPDDALLREEARAFSWNGSRFLQQIDIGAFSSRLKALTFDGLQEKGKGSYATVYRAVDRLSGDVITLKKLKLDRESEGFLGTAIREVSLLKQLRHPNIVELRDVLWDNHRLYLIMEHLDRDLREHLDVCPAASALHNVKSYMYQMLEGMAFIHANRVLHRDLKPQNILVESDTNTIKIADFGLARCFTPPVRAYTHEVITLLYRAPEILLGGTIYSTPVDIWSIGCIFAELVNGVPVFQGDSEIGQLFQIFQVLGTPSRATWRGVQEMPDWQHCFPHWPSKPISEVVPRLCPQGRDLLSQMLRYEPSSRISARQALQHPYFQDFTAADLSGQGSVDPSAPTTGPLAPLSQHSQESAASRSYHPFPPTRSAIVAGR